MAAYQYIYVMKDLCKTFPGGKEVLKHIWLSFFPGAKIGVIGPNGAGKSTLMKIMAGLDENFTGEAWPAEGVKVGYLPQEPQLDPSKNVIENIMDGVGEIRDLMKRWEEVNNAFADPDADMDKLLAEQAELQEKIDAVGGWDFERNVEIAMDALRCPPADADVTKLSGGEKRRVALCRLLLSKPDMLLLDEPTNHLDAESVAWLQVYLKNFPNTVVMITHDRYFLDNVTGWILEMDRGEGIPYEGHYTKWLEAKEKRLQIEQNAEDKRQKTLKEELEWVRSSPKARQAKSKARITAYEELLKKSNEKVPDVAQIVIPAGPRLGDVVLKAENLRKAFGDKLLFDNLSFNLPAGGIVGVIGPNGAGKTTLMRIITGQEKPDAGTFRMGETVKLGYVDQSRDSLNNDNTVWQEISGGNDMLTLGKREVSSRAYVHSAIAPGLGKIGVLVAVKGENVADIGKKVAMHVAASKPQFLAISDVDAATAEHERGIYAEQARASGKPEAIIEKMVEGRMRKFYEEAVLLEQAFVMDPDKKVKDVLAENKAEVSSFVRFNLGEGIEKKQEDFAAEVAKQLG